MSLSDGFRVAVVLPEGSPLRSAIEAHYQDQGGECRFLGEDDDIEERAAEKYALIFVDWREPLAHDFVAEVKIRRRTSRTPTLAIYPEDIAPGEYRPFTIVPDEEVRESIESDELLALSDRLLQRSRARPRHFLQDLTLRFSTQENEIDKAKMTFERLVEELGFDETAQALLAHSFSEAVGNAAEHGNHHKAEKMVRVAYLVDHEKMMWVVRDEGDGFDHISYMAKARGESPSETTTKRRDVESRPGGLGVHIMMKTCDTIAFNEEGNAIFLMKFLPDANQQNGAEAG